MLVQLLFVFLIVTHDYCYSILYMFLIYPRISLVFQNFAKDNHAYLEFHVDSCYVKKKDTNQIILKGFLKDGRYVFSHITIVF